MGTSAGATPGHQVNSWITIMSGNHLADVQDRPARRAVVGFELSICRAAVGPESTRLIADSGQQGGGARYIRCPGWALQIFDNPHLRYLDLRPTTTLRHRTWPDHTFRPYNRLYHHGAVRLRPALACLRARRRGLHGNFHVRIRYCAFIRTSVKYVADWQGLGGGLIALPSFLRDFGFVGLEPKPLADKKGNVVSILQAGW